MDTPFFSTKERILGAAEELFARHGFAGASLRQVTANARVNLAAVNYHFGSKDNLIEEVLRRRLDDLNERRLGALRELHAGTGATLEAILAAYIHPALDVSLDGSAGATFVRVLARAFADNNERLRNFLSNNYGHVLKQFATELAQHLPHLSKSELYSRLDIITGALTYAMTDFGVTQRRSDSSDAHRQRTAQHLIQFAAAGLRAA